MMISWLGVMLCLGIGLCVFRVCWHGAKLIVLTALGVASIVGGIAIFGSGEAPDFVHEGELEIRHWPQVQFTVEDDGFPTGVPHRWTLNRGIREERLSRSGMIALGSVLVIAGWLLVKRERTRPGAIKALALLGSAASGVVLVSFLLSAPHYAGEGPLLVSHDRIVKDPAAAAPVGADDDDTPVPKRAKRPKHAARGKRANSPAEHAETEDELLARLPRRAGEIPVDVELAAAQQVEPQLSSPAAVSAPEPASEASPPSVSPPAPVEATPPSAAMPAIAPPPETVVPPAPAAPATPPTSVPAPIAATPTATTPAATTDPGQPPVAVAAEPAENRPAWIDAPAKLDHSVYRVAVKSGLYVSVPECQRALDSTIKAEADHYIDEYLGEGASELVDVGRKFLRDHVLKSEFNDVVHVSVGPMHQIYALLEFDDDARAEFHNRWRNAVVTHRLWYAGSVGALSLALLATVYGYLKLNLKTGGTQKGRLQLAAALAALVATGAALAVRWAVPF
ncbi:MAG TPA: hypothetical protein VHV08_17365 [Pirellulales bacterium]|nr:hypothetical protein [Pirellulales bacterium]